MRRRIRITENDLHRIVKRSVMRALRENRLIAESYTGTSYAEVQFREYGFSDRLYNEFGIDDAEIDEYGKITVWDDTTNKTYQTIADYEIEYYGTGQPSARDPYEEEEEAEPVYDFDTAYQEISQQIRRDRGMNESHLRKIVKESIKKVLG